MRISTRDDMLTQTAEGYPVAQFYGYVTDGLFRSQEEIDAHAIQPGDTRVGDIRFKDLSTKQSSLEEIFVNLVKKPA